MLQFPRPSNDHSSLSCRRMEDLYVIPTYLQRENCQSVKQAESHVELHSASVFAGGTLDVAGMKVCN